MSQLVKLEKRFEDAIKRLELALSDKIVSKDVSGNFNEKEEVSKQGRDNNNRNRHNHLFSNRRRANN